MLRTRLWMGALAIALVVGVLLVDPQLGRWSPFLLILVLGLSLVACREFLDLLVPPLRPRAGLCYLLMSGLILMNWAPQVAGVGNVWAVLSAAIAASVMLTFVVEMAYFDAPGKSMERMALTVFIVLYLGLLPSFLVQLRWLDDGRQTVALAMAIFVPKCCDIGAYFTGRFLGRHLMAPVLSPKKTFEGAIGGLIFSVLAAVGINQLGPALSGGIWPAVAFGITVGIAGMLGDLAESLLKRDSGRKDASQIVPGFGGVLDVVDAILFAAPVSYCWFTCS
jgi:phosphatidate cytidylyltransferase